MAQGEESRAGGTLTCPDDGVPTRLLCAGCRRPICPACFVRTEVGLKCEKCAAPAAAAAVRPEARRRGAVIGAVVAGLVLAGGVAFVVARPKPAHTDAADIVAPSTTAASPGAAVVSGSLPDGATWAIQARRNGQGDLCTAFRRPSDAAFPPERCAADRGHSAFWTISRGPEGPRAGWLLWGAVTEEVATVRVMPSDGPTAEVPTVGGAGLGVRFYVWPVSREASLRLVALGATGQQVQAVTVPPVPSQ